MNPAKRRTSRRSHRGSTLWGLFGGLVVGLLIAFGVVWYLNKTPLPFEEKVTRPPTSESASAPQGEPAPLPGKPGDKPREKTQLDFYNILPGNPPAEAPTPPPATAPTAPPTTDAASPPATETKTPAVFYLQAGAFQNSEDAEKLKARLALLGFDADVQEANVPDKGVLHRVRIGPFRDTDEMNRARTTLAQNGVQTTVTKQKATATP
jgi:cell division protein FtsN